MCCCCPCANTGLRSTMHCTHASTRLSLLVCVVLARLYLQAQPRPALQVRRLLQLELALELGRELELVQGRELAMGRQRVAQMRSLCTLAMSMCGACAMAWTRQRRCCVTTMQWRQTCGRCRYRPSPGLGLSLSISTSRSVAIVHSVCSFSALLTLPLPVLIMPAHTPHAFSFRKPRPHWARTMSFRYGLTTPTYMTCPTMAYTFAAS